MTAVQRQKSNRFRKATPGKLHKIFCKKLLTMSNERCILHASKDSDASEPVPGKVSFTNLQAFESGQVMRGTHLQRVRGS